MLKSLKLFVMILLLSFSAWGADNIRAAITVPLT